MGDRGNFQSMEGNQNLGVKLATEKPDFSKHFTPCYIL